MRDSLIAVTVVIASSCAQSEPLAPTGISIVTPQDTVIVLGGSYHVAGDALYEDGSRGPVTLESFDSDIVSARGAVVTGAGYGRTRLLVSGGLDTLWVTVVPDGTLAAFAYPNGLSMFRTDLTDSRVLVGEGDPGWGGVYPPVADWDPAGNRVLYSSNGGI